MEANQANEVPQKILNEKTRPTVSTGLETTTNQGG